jgi:hypothetical protein
MNRNKTPNFSSAKFDLISIATVIAAIFCATRSPPARQNGFSCVVRDFGAKLTQIKHARQTGGDCLEERDE